MAEGLPRTDGRRVESFVAPVSRVAADVKALVAAGAADEARDRFGELVSLLQRRAVRIAYQYLRDAADADEAVQDAFVKVFLRIDRYREDLPFDVWFTRILINACLDRLKSRARHRRSILSDPDEDGPGRIEQVPDGGPSSEQQVLTRERWDRLARAVSALPERQRLVFTLSHIDERTAAEIGEATGMNPATVRVHLFRAIRKLRALLGVES